MTTGAWIMGSLPAVTFPVASYALRLGQHSTIRIGIIRAAVFLGAYAILTVELLSAVGLLTRAWFAVAWCLSLVCSLGGAYLRWRRCSTERVPLGRLGVAEWVMTMILIAFGGSTLLIALVAEPNNYDSMAYHLPKVEQWVATGSVELFPAQYFAQVAYTSGAEYLLLHLRMLVGGHQLGNLVQWGGAVLAAIAASHIARQFGVGRLGQVATAVLVWTVPMVLLQATSTQNDLITAAWCACVATLAIEATRSRPSPHELAALGLSFGLAWSAKSIGLVAGGIFLAMWFLTRCVRVRSGREALRLTVAAGSVAVAALLLVAPFVNRIFDAFGNPLGPAIVREHAMERHDPASVLVNTARMFHSATLVTDAKINAQTAGLVDRLAGVLGVEQREGHPAFDFPMEANPGPNEDSAPFPIHVLTVVIAATACVICRWRNTLLLTYTVTCGVVAIAIGASVKWQYWGNRFLLPVLVVSIPLVGVAVDLLLRRANKFAQYGIRTLLASTAVALAVVQHDVILNGNPRPLYSEWRTSVLTSRYWDTVFARQPSFQADYRWAAGAVRQTQARRVGLVLGDSLFEYPIWLLLPDQKLVHLISVVPTKPAPSPQTVDAIICLSPPMVSCKQYIPAGWLVEERTAAIVALPPMRDPIS